MIKAYKTTDTLLTEIEFENLEKGAWIDLCSPSAEELDLVSKKTGIAIDFLLAATDEEESSRIEIEPSQILVLIDIPLLRSNKDYETLPLGIILTTDYVITVCLEINAVITDMVTSPIGLFDTTKRTRFLFQILFKSATLYLKYIRNIIRRTDELERQMRKTMGNDELFRMLDLEKSLTYFSASLRSDYILTERLLKLRATNQMSPIIKIFEEDEDFLEDVIIEYKQAIDMVQMYTIILSSMLEIFAGIVSNNLNRVMKFLAGVTIVMAVPTMISGLWGMNVPVPFAENEYGFLIMTLLAFFISCSAAYVLWRKNMF